MNPTEFHQRLRKLRIPEDKITQITEDILSLTQPEHQPEVFDLMANIAQLVKALESYRGRNPNGLIPLIDQAVLNLLFLAPTTKSRGIIIHHMLKEIMLFDYGINPEDLVKSLNAQLKASQDQYKDPLRGYA